MQKTTITFFWLLAFYGHLLGQDITFTGYATCSIKKGIPTFQTNGVQDQSFSTKYDTSTIQPIGSVSKTVVGLAIMKAVELGMVDLEADINMYLNFKVANPRVKHNGPITLKHLATHTSGIIDNEKYYLRSYSNSLLPQSSLSDFLTGYLKKGGKLYSKKNFGKLPAGGEYNYSNIGAALAALVIECASKQPFDQFTAKYIFQPIGMKSTAWFYNPGQAEKYSTLFDENDKPLEHYSLATYPDGGLNTTIVDLSKYLKTLMDGYKHHSDLLKTDSWAEYFAKHFTSQKPIKGISPKEPNIGIFIVYSKNGTIGHTGSDPGVSVVMFFNPEMDEGKIFMANEDITPNNLPVFKKIWAAL